MTQIGDVFRLKNWRDYPRPDPTAPVGLVWMDYKHPDKNKVGVFIFIGVENKDGTGPKIEADEVLIAMGWTPPPDAKKES